MNTTPPYLAPGNTIGIVATARKILPRELTAAIRTFQNWGLKVILGKNIYGEHHQYSGTDKERAADLQSMLDDPDIRAVVIARGGYGTVRVIDHIDFSGFIHKPKWIVGFSDITVLHSHIHQRFGIETIHAMMPLNMVGGKKMIARKEALESLHRALFGERLEYQIPTHSLNRPGKAEGQLTGGNLSVLYSLSGSVSDIDTEGKILFLEDLDEYLYHIDRMMVCFDRAGKLKGINGLVIGGMTKMKDNKVPFGKTAEEIVADVVKKYKFPVCYGFPAGHMDDNRALILGRKVQLNIGGKRVHLKFQ